MDSSTHIQFLKEEGNRFVGQQQYGNAINCYIKCIQINPEYFHAFHNLGSTLLLCHQYCLAIPILEKALFILRDKQNCAESFDRVAAFRQTVEKLTQSFIMSNQFEQLLSFIERLENHPSFDLIKNENNQYERFILNKAKCLKELKYFDRCEAELQILEKQTLPSNISLETKLARIKLNLDFIFYSSFRCDNQKKNSEKMNQTIFLLDEIAKSCFDSRFYILKSEILLIQSLLFNHPLNSSQLSGINKLYLDRLIQMNSLDELALIEKIESIKANSDAEVDSFEENLKKLKFPELKSFTNILIEMDQIFSLKLNCIFTKKSNEDHSNIMVPNIIESTLLEALNFLNSIPNKNEEIRNLQFKKNVLLSKFSWTQIPCLYSFDQLNSNIRFENISNPILLYQQICHQLDQGKFDSEVEQNLNIINAKCLEALGFFEKSQHHFEDSERLEKNKNNHILPFLTGSLKQRLGFVDEALKDFEKSASIACTYFPSLAYQKLIDDKGNIIQVSNPQNNHFFLLVSKWVIDSNQNKKSENILDTFSQKEIIKQIQSLKEKQQLMEISSFLIRKVAILTELGQLEKVQQIINTFQQSIKEVCFEDGSRVFQDFNLILQLISMKNQKIDKSSIKQILDSFNHLQNDGQFDKQLMQYYYIILAKSALQISFNRSLTYLLGLIYLFPNSNSLMTVKKLLTVFASVQLTKEQDYLEIKELYKIFIELVFENIIFKNEINIQLIVEQFSIFLRNSLLQKLKKQFSGEIQCLLDISISEKPDIIESIEDFYNYQYFDRYDSQLNRHLTFNTGCLHNPINGKSIKVPENQLLQLGKEIQNKRNLLSRIIIDHPQVNKIHFFFYQGNSVNVIQEFIPELCPFQTYISSLKNKQKIDDLTIMENLYILTQISSFLHFLIQNKILNIKIGIETIMIDPQNKLFFLSPSNQFEKETSEPMSNHLIFFSNLMKQLIPSQQDFENKTSPLLFLLNIFEKNEFEYFQQISSKYIQEEQLKFFHNQLIKIQITYLLFKESGMKCDISSFRSQFVEVLLDYCGKCQSESNYCDYTLNDIKIKLEPYCINEKQISLAFKRYSYLLKEPKWILLFNLFIRFSDLEQNHKQNLIQELFKQTMEENQQTNPSQSVQFQGLSTSDGRDDLIQSVIQHISTLNYVSSYLRSQSPFSLLNSLIYQINNPLTDSIAARSKLSRIQKEQEENCKDILLIVIKRLFPSFGNHRIEQLKEKYLNRLLIKQQEETTFLSTLPERNQSNTASVLLNEDLFEIEF